MPPSPLRTATAVATTHILLVAAASAVAVYAADRFDPSWGRAYTWQILCALGVATGILAFFGALFGSVFAARGDRALPQPFAILAGILTAILLGALVYLKHEFRMEGGLFGAVLGSMLVPFAVALRLSRTE